MTESEAIKVLERLDTDNVCVGNEKFALETAIHSLSEIQQYRAIGTVEQLEWCKDASHWKEMFKEKLEQYEAIGTVSEFRELKEKATAKTARLKKGIYHCPSCGMAFAVVEQGYCIFCGQHMR